MFLTFMRKGFFDLAQGLALLGEFISKVAVLFRLVLLSRCIKYFFNIGFTLCGNELKFLFLHQRTINIPVSKFKLFFIIEIQLD